VFTTVLEVKPMKIKAIKEISHVIPAGRKDITKEIILSAIGLEKNNVVARQQDEYIRRNRICHLVSGP
jgi:hypothetical protein